LHVIGIEASGTKRSGVRLTGWLPIVHLGRPKSLSFRLPIVHIGGPKLLRRAARAEETFKDAGADALLLRLAIYLPGLRRFDVINPVISSRGRSGVSDLNWLLVGVIVIPPLLDLASLLETRPNVIAKAGMYRAAQWSADVIHEEAPACKKAERSLRSNGD
jgi:hypothetical protein